MRVVIQGEAGSFHHQVAVRRFGEQTDIIAAESFSDVFKSLERGEADYAVVAIENSLYGSINDVYDLLEAHSYPIIGEVYLRIEQQLISLPGATMSDITTIYSHPVALAQCEQSLESLLPHAERVEYHDTAAAVRFIQETGDIHAAAVASQLAADLYDLPVIQANVEDHHANYTRFVVLAATPEPVTGADKTSLVFETNHTPGSLASILNVFAEANSNVSKLQSRPIVGKVWTYRFYIDVEVAGPAMEALLEQLASYNANVTVLGQYISDTLPAA